MTFALLRAIPGNVAVAIMGPGAYRDPAAIKLFDNTYGFNKPWYSQYLLWLSHLVRGNLGYSWNLNQSVASLLANRLLKSVVLVGISTILALIIAIPIGVIQAVRRNKFIDHFFNGTSTLFYAMPSFLLGLLLILIFAIKFPIFPAEGPQGNGLGAILSNFNALILPIATLTLITVALFSRYMRSSVLDNLTEDYVRTAKAKGASERRILVRHVTPQLADPDRHAARAEPARYLVRRADHRGGLQLPGDGPAVLPAGAEAGLPDPAGYHRGRRGRDGRRIATRGYYLRGA